MRPRKTKNPTANTPDPAMAQVCRAIADALQRLQIDWPMLITISGFDGTRADANAMVHPGQGVERPELLGEQSEVLAAITRISAVHLISTEEVAMQLACLYDIRPGAVAETYERLRNMPPEKRT